jgi:predicted DsbA family dithiol-disulfide isomerase
LRAKPGLALGERERMKVRVAAAETGISVNPPAAWLDSSAALRGAEMARDAGVFAAYHGAVFRAAFEDRADIGRIEVLADLAEGVGLERARFIHQATEAGAMADRIAANKREADDFSALGYPTFILGDFPLIGIQPIETMRLLLKRYMEKRAAEPQA